MFPPILTLPRQRLYRLGSALMLPVAAASAIAITNLSQSATGQTAGANRALTVRSDVQEANAQTGVITARGHVQINYPARQIQATSTQAQYFSRERRLVLSGDVYVLQQGNSIRGETVTYLIDEGRFVAVPRAERQVESIYIVSDPNPLTQSLVAPEMPPLERQPAAKTPASVPSPARGNKL